MVGGGPGSGPVGCKAILEKYLPDSRVIRKTSDVDSHFTKKDTDMGKREYYSFAWNKESSIGRVKDFYGNFLVVVRALTFIYAREHHLCRETSFMQGNIVYAREHCICKKIPFI